MLRSVTLGLTLFILAAACALVEPPPPAGTRPIQVQIENRRPGPVQLTIASHAVVLEGAADELTGVAQPASVPAGSTTNVTFHVPINRDWWIGFNGEPGPGSEDLGPDIGTCTMGVLLTANGGLSMGCRSGP